jgi:DNA-binding response OmpR family regulator
VTRRQYAILEHLMRKPGQVVTQEELLEHVWGSEMNPFTNTVRMHILSLRRKLGDGPSGPPVIETVVGEGYRLNCHDAQGD